MGQIANLKSLFEAIRKARGPRAVCTIDSLPSGITEDAEIANQFVARHQMGGLATWHPITRTDAAVYLTRAITEHLVYSPRMSPPKVDNDTATKWAMDFLAMFSAECQCLTNGFYMGKNKYVIMGTTDDNSHVCDTGVIAYDDRRIGMIWLFDTD